jgi:hypothetical protein
MEEITKKNKLIEAETLYAMIARDCGLSESDVKKALASYKKVLVTREGGSKIWKPFSCVIIDIEERIRRHPRNKDVQVKVLAHKKVRFKSIKILPN